MRGEIVEVGMPLKKNLIYYHDMLQKHGLDLVFACITHDIYFSKRSNFNGLTENQIKNACVRLRTSREIKGDVISRDENVSKQEQKLISKGYRKVFDTIKLDFHYHKPKMASRVQLQDIAGVGLLVYYDNKNYYNYPPKQQRKLLIDELNSYGFKFKHADLGVDKLRTLYYGKKMFSENQNA